MNSNNRNIIAGVLAVVILGGLVYFAASSRLGTPVSEQAPVVTPNDNGTPVANPTPSAPIVLTSSTVAASISTAALTGTVNPKGLGTAYWYEYGETGSLGTKTVPQSLGASYATISAPLLLSGLKPTTTYYYRLSAENSKGIVNGAVYTFKTNTSPVPVGGVPSGKTLSATNINRTSAVLNGEVNSNKAPTNYWFEYGPSQSLGSITGIQTMPDDAGSPSISIAVSGLLPQTKYYFRLNTQNRYGTVLGTTISFTTTGPGVAVAPEAGTLEASNVGRTTFTLNGRVDPNGASTTYWFEYSTDASLNGLTQTSSQTLSSTSSAKVVKFDVRNLEPNTKYYFRSAAQNQNGIDYGDTQSVTTRR